MKFFNPSFNLIPPPRCASARILNMKQASVSKMERRTDIYISTLRKMLKAMGGDLQIIANFPEGKVIINQFEDVEGQTA